MTLGDGAFLGTAVGFLSGACWRVGAGGSWGGVVCLAVLCDGLVGGIWGCIGISVAFGASDWCVSVCGWAWGSLVLDSPGRFMLRCALGGGWWCASGWSHHLDHFPNLFSG